jgi:hypothetical protein
MVESSGRDFHRALFLGVAHPLCDAPESTAKWLFACRVRPQAVARHGQVLAIDPQRDPTRPAGLAPCNGTAQGAGAHA